MTHVSKYNVQCRLWLLYNMRKKKTVIITTWRIVISHMTNFRYET